MARLLVRGGDPGGGMSTDHFLPAGLMSHPNHHDFDDNDVMQYFHRVMITGMKMRTVGITAVFRKALHLANSSRQKTTVGEMVNLMAVDAQACCIYIC
jgi:hypothetical protein